MENGRVNHVRSLVDNRGCEDVVAHCARVHHNILPSHDLSTENRPGGGHIAHMFLKWDIHDGDGRIYMKTNTSLSV